MPETIHFYHTNDVHSHFDKWPRIVDFVNERKNLHSETGEETLILDIGDHMDRWHPFTEGTHGKGNVMLLNDAGYDYVTIGNNEGITLPHESLDELYEGAQFKVLVANLFNLDGKRPGWALPYAIHTTRKGTRIGMVGVTAFFEAFYSKLDWQISDPFQELAIQLEKIKSQTDVIVILSHLGIHDDERMAKDFPEIDVILGSHTHHILHHGKLVNNGLLCCAGKFGMFLGHVELTIDDNRSVIAKTASLYDTNEIDENASDPEWLEKIIQNGKEALNEICVDLPRPISSDWFERSELPEIMCKAVREWCDADCALLNAGLALDSLPKGLVTKGDIHRILPHPINPCTVLLSGSELKETLLESRNPEWPHLQLNGFGFRGKVLGTMVYDGIEFVCNENDQVISILINGLPLQREQIYKLALPDMFTFGHFFPNIHRSKTKEYHMPEFLRDVMAWKLKNMFQ
ncbi:bifunctional metallophosphatase/5'-nucleotidase [Peribacillus sp. SCS-155]|uniref:bifunctional metallophosphatase/5'-nucleotidase n=1 Tax=Peribacillus sedimenti TaxID=3115297 RepID=UPI00390579DF